MLSNGETYVFILPITGIYRYTYSSRLTRPNYPPIQAWVAAYLGAMQDLADLHAKYLATTGAGNASE